MTLSPVHSAPAHARRLGLALLAAGTLAGVVACGPAPGTFVVDSTADAADARIDGTCRTSAGNCTLRAAVQEAEAASGHNTVQFNIPGAGPHQISLTSALPILYDGAGVTIDGYSQPGAVKNTSTTASNAVIKIGLKGNGPSGIDGLDVRSPGNVIAGLALWDFNRAVRFLGEAANDNEVVGSFIGTNPAGTFGAPSYIAGPVGVHLQAGAHDNRVGKSGNEHRNVISGNAQHGVALYDFPTRANLVQNNIVGLNPAGTAGLPNRSHGIDVNTFAADNLIGGNQPGQGNVVSGNSDSGVEISHGRGTVRNDVIGNRIGATPSGTAAPAYARNLGQGVNLEGVQTCVPKPDPCLTADAGESLVEGNVIVNNGYGVHIHKADHDNIVRNNLIGVLANGTPAPNVFFSVRIEKGSFGNQIGPGNVIAHNANGVQVVPTGLTPNDPSPVRTYENQITQNSIFANTGLGIDLAPTGAVSASPDPLVNDGIAIPTTFGPPTSAAVTMRTCSGCTVELFLADSGAGQYGEGRTYLTSAVADGTGTAVVPVPASAKGQVVTATATTPAGSTSEFSQNVFVPA